MTWGIIAGVLVVLLLCYGVAQYRRGQRTAEAKQHEATVSRTQDAARIREEMGTASDDTLRNWGVRERRK